MSYICHFIIWN